MRKSKIFLMMLVMVSPIFFTSVNNVKAVRPFIYGTMEGPAELEYMDAYDSASIDCVVQSLETLYATNLSDSPDFEMVPCLAANFGTWSPDGLETSIPLRQNVTFHDGSKFNATSVKWAMDRLTYMLTEDPTGIQTADLFLYDGEPILNKTEIVSEYVVNMTLNVALPALWDILLTTWVTSIMKPNDNMTRWLTLTDDLIGTGPFVYDGYVPGQKVTFHAYENYWGGVANIPSMVWQVIDDDDTRSLAMVNHEIHMIDSALPAYTEKLENDPSINFIKVKGLCTYYVAYNVEMVPLAHRKALSYATNLTYLIDDIMEGECYPWQSPVPEGILYANESFDGVPNFNITKAREILIDSGDAASHNLNASSTDDDWITVANSSNPIAEYNFTTHSGLIYTIGEALKSMYEKIGIKMKMTDRIEWKTFVDKMNGRNGHSKNELTISIGAWCPDYNDPINFISPLYKNDSSSNQFQLNDPTLEQLMLDSYTADPEDRQQMFNDMQELIAATTVPSYNLWQFEEHTVYNKDIIGNYPVNPFGRTYFYPCTFNEPPAPAVPGYELGIMLVASLAVVFILLTKKEAIVR